MANHGRCKMSALSEAVDQYLAIRRGLGAKLRGVDSVFRNFTDFAEQEQTSHITTDLVLRWVQEQTGILPATRAFRFQLVRRFAVWRSATDPRTEIPPNGLVTGRYRRKQPYIYSDREIKELIKAARRLPPSTALKGHTYATIFALLAVTGLRISEALALDREDVMLEEGMLRIRHAKFDKSRLVPIHPSTSKALAAYARRRDKLIRPPLEAAFFLSDRGLRVTGGSTRYNFARISQQLGLRDAPRGPGRHGRGPRLHDLRHRFAANTLLDWYRAGANVEREIPKLSTYLGHAHINDTYWYIEAVPELLELASRRLAEHGTEGQP